MWCLGKIVLHTLIYNHFEIIQLHNHIIAMKICHYIYCITIGIRQRKRSVKYETPVANPFILNIEGDYPPSKKGTEPLHSNVFIMYM